MLRKSHIVTSEAITTGALAAANVNLPFIFVSMGGVWLGAQLPDVDNSSTRINHKLGPVGKLLSKLKHRTWTHTIWAVLLLLVIAVYCPVSSYFDVKLSDPALGLGNLQLTDNYLKAFLLFVVWGYFLHLVEDNFSKMGDCFIYPFGKFRMTRYGTPCKKRPFHHWYYRTGGNEEKYIRWAMTVTFAAEIFGLFAKYYLEGD